MTPIGELLDVSKVEFVKLVNKRIEHELGDVRIDIRTELRA
jgi:hypothetical protein